jgi:hypothetical protein
VSALCLTDAEGNRDTLGTGFNASVDYVRRALVAEGYSPVLQPFSFSYFEAAAPPQLSIAGAALPPTVFNNLRFSGSGTVPADALIWAVGSGCSATTYPAEFVKGRDVALAFDSTECSLSARVQVATQTMDATGLVVGLSVTSGVMSSPQLTVSGCWCSSCRSESFRQRVLICCRFLCLY